MPAAAFRTWCVAYAAERGLFLEQVGCIFRSQVFHPFHIIILLLLGPSKNLNIPIDITNFWGCFCTVSPLLSNLTITKKLVSELVILSVYTYTLAYTIYTL